MADEREVDEHLIAVLDAVLDAVYQAKQAAWSHNRGNLVAEAHENHAEAASILAGHVTTSSVRPAATR